MGDTQTGLLDLSAYYDDGKRHAALKGFDYLHLQAGTSIKVEQDAIFISTSTFKKAPKLYSLTHVSSGGHIVFASDGATLAYLSSSSKRYKDHIADMTLEEARRILNIPVIWFKYKDNYLSETDWLNGKKLPGLYAEDVYAALPEAAQINKKGEPEDWNFRVIIPAMLKLIQNLYERT